MGLTDRLSAMAKTRHDGGSPRLKSLSATACAELREVLGTGAKSSQLVAALETVARLHDGPHERDLQADWVAATKKSAGAAEGRRLATAIRATIRRIDEYLPRISSRVTLASLAGHTPTAIRLTSLRRALEAELEALDLRHRRAPRNAGGAPPDTSINTLSLDIGMILRLHGRDVTVSRTGKFARVLAIVQTEVFGRAPEDQYRRIRKIARFLNRYSLDELRDITQKTAKYRGNTAFWMEAVQRPGRAPARRWRSPDS